MPGPRLAYILLWFPEPTQTFILDEVNTLIRLGAAVKVYTLYGPRSPGRVAGMAPVGAPVRHLGLQSLGDLAKDLGRFWRTYGQETRGFLTRAFLRRWRSLETMAEAAWAILSGVSLAPIFERDGVRHIHASWANGPATAAWVASRLSGIPFSFCARAHDIHPPDGALREKLRAAAFVRVNSRANYDFLAALAPQEAPKLTIIYNGVPLSASPAPPKPRQTPFRLLAIGRLVEKKGFDQLLSACRHLLTDGLDFHLTLAGDGPQRRRLQHLISTWDLHGRVAMPGFVLHRHIPSLLQQADLLIMPSRVDPAGDRDGIPNVIIESLAHEVPVVASNVSGIPEVIHPGNTGWLVPPNDPRALAQAITDAWARPEEARRRARAGRRLVLKEFDSTQNYGRLKAWLEASARQA